MADPFIAEVRMFGCNFAPRGWAFCNGQMVNISENTAMFAVMGIAFGGDGRTNFALPDLRDRAPMHAGQGPGLQDHKLGSAPGSMYVSLVSQNLPEHSHTLTAANVIADSATPDSTKFLAKDDRTTEGNVLYVNDDTQPTTDLSYDALKLAGGGTPHYNMQPFQSVNFCIAMTGIFPSRN